MSDFNSIFGNLLGEESEIKIPEGGGTFFNTGFIGPMMTKKLWKFWSREDIKHYDQPYKVNVDYTFVLTKTGSYFYYFVNEDAGKVAAKALEAYAPNPTWRFEMPTASIINFQSADAVDKFGQAISADVRLVSLNSKYRHEYHMLNLPSLVDAAARLTGNITAPIWHCSELLEVNDGSFTDEFQARLIGNPDAKKADMDNFALLLEAVNGNIEKAQDIALGEADIEGELSELKGNVRIPWQYSLLWQRRVALWKALGEDNPEVYLPIGDTKTCTTSQVLSDLLALTTREWKTTLWVRMHSIPDPSMSNVYESNGVMQHGKLPIIGEIYADETAARAAVESEGGTPATATSTTAADAKYPPMPKVWDGVPVEQWIEVLRDKKNEVGGKLPATPPARIALAKALECDAEDLAAWWDLV